MKKRKVGELYGHPIVDGYESLTLKHEIHVDDLLKENGNNGGAIINQEKTIKIIENGITKVSPDKGFTGLSQVTITTAIPNEEKYVEITENGEIEITPDNGFLSKVTVNTNILTDDNETTPSRPSWTGHADAEGLKAIGWTDEDISYYQEHGVNWNEEDDEYHKVTDDNKALYGVLTADNISSYKDRIVYLPKIDTSGVTYMHEMFKKCYSLVAIPQLNTSSVMGMDDMFYNCHSLTFIPQLDTNKVTSMNSMFYNCHSLTFIPQLDTNKVRNMNNMFHYCSALPSIPQLDTSSVTSMYGMFKKCYSLVAIPQLNTSSVTDTDYMFDDCRSLTSIPQLDTNKVTGMSNMFNSCYSLVCVNLKNVKLANYFTSSPLLSKESLLYLINNEAATSEITIQLASYAYTRLSTDADIVAALAAHPNISITQ